ncbi:MAG: hypothetical protein HC889_16020 [Synechococcaceae cyanobacterium SM1_2_3]|nr:hypothetical protein [Synechococcaceae cyanobacterium SM1_2_3]
MAMNVQEQQLMVNLIRNRRWAALASLGADGPEASWVAYAPEADFNGFLLHLSTLSAHTRNLLADPRASLAISEPERDGEDPQTLARVMIQGKWRSSPRTAPIIQPPRCAISSGCPIQPRALRSAIFCCCG